MTSVFLPELGEGITEAVVACWHVKVGQAVHADDDLVEVVTDKATFHVPVSQNGVIQDLLVAEGQVARVGQPLVVLR